VNDNYKEVPEHRGSSCEEVSVPGKRKFLNIEEVPARKFLFLERGSS
jgi:hypothetical protein